MLDKWLKICYNKHIVWGVKVLWTRRLNIDKYISLKAQQVAYLILIKSLSGRTPPVMRKLRAEHHFRLRWGYYPEHFYEIVEE